MNAPLSRREVMLVTLLQSYRSLENQLHALVAEQWVTGAVAEPEVEILPEPKKLTVGKQKKQKRPVNTLPMTMEIQVFIERHRQPFKIRELREHLIQEGYKNPDPSYHLKKMVREGVLRIEGTRSAAVYVRVDKSPKKAAPKKNKRRSSHRSINYPGSGGTQTRLLALARELGGKFRAKDIKQLYQKRYGYVLSGGGLYDTLNNPQLFEKDGSYFQQLSGEQEAVQAEQAVTWPDAVSS